MLKKKKMKKQADNQVILSGGGTGGHIFPAIAIAQELSVLRTDLEFLFVGAKGKMEMDKVPKAGFPIIGLPVSAFHRRITWKNLIFPFKLVVSMIKASQIIRKYQPVLVIGTGGFASGPLLKAASRHGVPTLVQEQNAFPGVTNRLLARRAQKICVAHNGMEEWFDSEKIILSGNPVRKDLSSMEFKKPEALDYFKLNSHMPVALLFGGSLGALALNEAIASSLEKIRDMGIQLIWQTGQGYYEKARKLVEQKGVEGVHVFAFLERMDLAYAAADVLMCRAGAITLSELCLATKPAILVPYPAAAGNHQMKNALSFRDKNAAWVLENHEAKEKLIDLLKELMGNQKEQNIMKENLAKLARPEAGKHIAKVALEIIDKNLSK